MTTQRYLTKSRFKLALECPTKLFYTGKREYVNQTLDDQFLQALADGGHQVGELAKHYFPDGVEIHTLRTADALAQTNELLKQDNVVIYEAAINYQNLLIRVDVLIKRPGHLQLVEVKAKSYNPDKDGDFRNTKDQPVSTWKPYLFDIAFQKYVTQLAFPEMSVSSYLMLADKTAVCATDGLNQKFMLTRDENSRRGVKVHHTLSQEDLTQPVLKKINVDSIVNQILTGNNSADLPCASFHEAVQLFSHAYSEDSRLEQKIGAKCKSCEFKCNSTDKALGLKSGFNECWQRQLHWTDEDLSQPNILSLWNFRQTEHFIEERQIKLTALSPEDLNTDGSVSSPLKSVERQWLQISKVQEQDHSAYLDRNGLKAEMASHSFPLHFIDFETCTTALPYFKGMVPYETIAFQFSHHLLHKDGSVEHKTQFIDVTPGSFPNFKFVRALKAALEQDNGSIFRYSNHENTVLNHIANQLSTSAETDRDELITFIQSITRSTGSKSKTEGPRAMVDLLELVKFYYYDPATNGSNSIKAVLPAILNSSAYLQELYGDSIYGTLQMPSHNFHHHCWIKKAGDKVIDPYQQLPKLFADASEHDIALLSEEDELNNGGLALSAYGKLQFTEMSDYERQALEAALLKYCELDTLAMVMIYQGWQHMLSE